MTDQGHIDPHHRCRNLIINVEWVHIVMSSLMFVSIYRRKFTTYFMRNILE